MILVHHNAVMVLATSVTAATWVLAVFANAAMACADVPALLPVLLQPCAQPAALSSAYPDNIVIRSMLDNSIVSIWWYNDC